MTVSRPAYTMAAASIVGLCFAFACSNPADGKPEAQVGDPVPRSESSADAVVLAVDPTRSSIEFTGSKVTGKHEGGFDDFAGSIELVDDDPTASRVWIEIDTTSLWADDDRLTKHLKSPDFFEVETYPQATFESTTIEQSEDGYVVTGNLDLHGVTKSISFPAAIEVGIDGTVSAQAEFFIQRFDFAIVYPGKPDDLIRDEVVIRFDLVATPDEDPTPDDGGA